jgi:hypothetical protein
MKELFCHNPLIYIFLFTPGKRKKKIVIFLFIEYIIINLIYLLNLFNKIIVIVYKNGSIEKGILIFLMKTKIERENNNSKKIYILNNKIERLKIKIIYYYIFLILYFIELFVS